MKESDFNDTTLVALTQLCTELDNLYFPVNSKGAAKELQSWSGEAQRQGVNGQVLQALRELRGEEIDRAARMKKLVACLLWMSQMNMSDIEKLIMRHGGAFNGAAGSIISAASRTGDFITVVANICGLVLNTDELKDRALRLQTRLETGAPQEIIYLASECGTNLSRADYQRLTGNGLSQINDLRSASDETLLSLVEGNQKKLKIIKDGIRRHDSRPERQQQLPEIPLFK